MLWIASRSLSSGAHSRDPLARNDGYSDSFPNGGRTMKNIVICCDGKISENISNVLKLYIPNAEPRPGVLIAAVTTRGTAFFRRPAPFMPRPTHARTSKPERSSRSADTRRLGWLPAF
jgi:hypothetical protein